MIFGEILETSQLPHHALHIKGRLSARKVQVPVGYGPFLHSTALSFGIPSTTSMQCCRKGIVHTYTHKNAWTFSASFSWKSSAGRTDFIFRKADPPQSHRESDFSALALAYTEVSS